MKGRGWQPPLAPFSRLHQENTMSLREFAEALPDYAKDIRLNLNSLAGDQTLGDQRKWGLLLACAHGAGYRPLV